MTSATDELSQLREMYDSGQPGKRRAALRGITTGLMRGQASAFKLGYSAENAMMAAARYFRVTEGEVKLALAPEPDELVTFLRWLVRERGLDAEAVIDVVEKPRNWWQQHADSLVAEMDDASPSPTL